MIRRFYDTKIIISLRKTAQKRLLARNLSKFYLKKACCNQKLMIFEELCVSLRKQLVCDKRINAKTY